MTRLLLGIIQIGLAMVFVPLAILILSVVGVYMIVERIALKGGDAIRFCRRPTAERPGDLARARTAATHIL